MRARLAVAAIAVLAGGAAVAMLAARDDANGDPSASATRAWLPLAGSPLSRTEVGAARIGRFIYVVGGFLSDGATTNQVARYDTRSNSWALLAPMPVGVNHPAVTAHRGRLYVHGGYTADGGLAGAIDHLYRYDPGRNAWRRLRSSGPPRAAHTLAAFRGRLFAIGGARAGRPLRLLEIYDIRRNRWRRGPSMRVAREHLASALSRGTILVVAGRARGRNLRAVERYDPRRGRWSRVRPVRRARSGIAAVSVRGRLVVVFGGEDLFAGGRTIRPVEAHLPRSGRWVRLPGMRTPRHGLGGAVRGLRIYALEGGPQPGLTVSSAVEFIDVRRALLRR